MRKSLGKFDAFVGYIWTKIGRDTQYSIEKLNDSATYLKHLLFILLEFDADYSTGEGQLGRNFYDGLKPLIKL